MKHLWLIPLTVTACALVTLAPAPVSTDNGCRAMCRRYQDLGCEAGAATPDGAPCEEWCDAAEQEGVDIAGVATCSEAAQTCDAVGACASKI